MKVKPLNNKILVKVHEVKERNLGKLIIPATVTSLTEKNIKATVLEVGPGKRDAKGSRTVLDIKPGNTIILSKYAGFRFFVEDQSFMMIDIEEILAVED